LTFLVVQSLLDCSAQTKAHAQVGAVKVTNLLMCRPQTMLTKFKGSLMTLHDAEEDAVNWLNSVKQIAGSQTAAAPCE